jgi:hypothetical protein
MIFNNGPSISMSFNGKMMKKQETDLSMMKNIKSPSYEK